MGPQGRDTTAYDNLVAWLKRIQASSPPPADIIAFNFGLFETDSGYTTYLTGSRSYDRDDDDWACAEDYAPGEKYFALPEEFSAGKKWQVFQRTFMQLLVRFINSPESADSFLKSKIITVGFDDGNLERVN